MSLVHRWKSMEQDDKRLMLVLLFSIILMNIPYASYAFYPFKLFATWIHEMFHGITALIFGGSIKSIAINADTSGLTGFTMPQNSGTGLFITSSMGYLGTSLFGALLLIMRRHKRAQQGLLLLIGLALLLSVILYVRNTFGIVVVLAMALTFVFLALYLSNSYAELFVHLLASQCCLNALLDIKILYSVAGGHSDAHQVAEQVGLWAWFWASLWLLLSLAIFYGAWKMSKVRKPTASSK